jgi:TolB protein
MKHHTKLLALVTILLALASCNENPLQPSEGPLLPGGPEDPLAPGGPIDGRLAFVSSRDGIDTIYLADESGVTRLAPGDRPAWSPDGSQIAFNGVDGAQGIFVMNSDGTGVRHLGRGGNPDWSPDGRRIVFDLNGEGIFAMNADGSAVERLIDHGRVRTPSGGDCFLQTPAWSPDGRHIAFVCASYDDPWEIHLVNADGSNPRRFACCTGDSAPTWSFDGLQIAFDAGGRSIVVENVDGSGRRTVVRDGFWADWSGDGRFAFTRITGPGPTYLDGDETRIFVTAENGGERQLIPNAVNPAAPVYGDSQPAWAP